MDSSLPLPVVPKRPPLTDSQLAEDGSQYATARAPSHYGAIGLCAQTGFDMAQTRHASEVPANEALGAVVGQTGQRRQMVATEECSVDAREHPRRQTIEGSRTLLVRFPILQPWWHHQQLLSRNPHLRRCKHQRTPHASRASGWRPGVPTHEHRKDGYHKRACPCASSGCALICV